MTQNTDLKPIIVPRVRRGRVWLRRLLLALALFLASGEIGLRVAGVGARLPIFCTWNPRIGCMTKADVHETLEMGDLRYAFSTQANGLRNAPVGAKAAGVKRVLVLGDSVTFAPQVPDNAPFANLLDAALRAEHVEVVNAGSVYLRATDQELSWFLDVGAAMQPDLVVVEFTERNDFVDNQHQYWWLPGGKGLERQTNVPPLPHDALVLATNEWPIVGFLDDWSRLFGLFRIASWNIMHLPHVDTGKRWRESTEDVLVRLKQEVEARGARLAVLIYPSPEQLAGMRGERELRPDNNHARILSIVSDQHLASLDLTPLLAATTARDLQDGDGHLTVAGHKAVAQLLAPQVRTWLQP